jgi:hypothetical protein
MARIPQVPYHEPPKRHQRETKAVVKPDGKFKRPYEIHITTDRAPENVTRINPEDMKPVLPEMPYIPPA